MLYSEPQQPTSVRLMWVYIVCWGPIVCSLVSRFVCIDSSIVCSKVGLSWKEVTTRCIGIASTIVLTVVCFLLLNTRGVELHPDEFEMGAPLSYLSNHCMTMYLIRPIIFSPNRPQRYQPLLSAVGSRIMTRNVLRPMSFWQTFRGSSSKDVLLPGAERLCSCLCFFLLKFCHFFINNCINQNRVKIAHSRAYRKALCAAKAEMPLSRLAAYHIANNASPKTSRASSCSTRICEQTMILPWPCD